MALQLFGTPKCRETAKAARWLKERRIEYHFRDVAEKPVSPGELDSIARAVGGMDALVDKESRAWTESGLAWMESDAREELLARPSIMKTPVLRDGSRAIVGFDPAEYAAFAG